MLTKGVKFWICYIDTAGQDEHSESWLVFYQDNATLHSTKQKAKAYGIQQLKNLKISEPDMEYDFYVSLITFES